jgi:hypothetical protein
MGRGWYYMADVRVKWSVKEHLPNGDSVVKQVGLVGEQYGGALVWRILSNNSPSDTMWFHSEEDSVTLITDIQHPSQKLIEAIKHDIENRVEVDRVERSAVINRYMLGMI